MFLGKLRKKIFPLLHSNPPAKSDLVGILIVNGGRDPREGKWLSLCLTQIVKHTKWPNYRIYVWNNNIEDNYVTELIKETPNAKIFEASPNTKLKHIHAVPLQRLYQIAKKDKVSFIVTMDTDAFPVKDNWLTYLIQQLNRKTVISGVWRDELEKYIKPYIHASCLCTSINFIDTHRLRFDKVDIASDEKMDTVGCFTSVAKNNGKSLFKLKRSNVNELHYLMGGLYGNLIYHHGAGSRKKTYFWGEKKTELVGKRNNKIKEKLNQLVFQYNEQYIKWLMGYGNNYNNDLKDSKTVFILGMHRSGTSCLAGCLEACGLFLGEVSKFNVYNQKGNQELRDFTLLHDRILNKNKGSWDNPPDRIKITSQDKTDFQKILDSFPDNVICGIKDPRTLLMAEYLVEIQKNIVFIATYRHPLSVAFSLKRRNEISIDKGLSLWNIYNDNLVRLHRKYAFPIIKFDLNNPNKYTDFVAQAAIELGLNPDLKLMSEFVRQELEHEQKKLQPIPNTCLKTYNYLEDICFKKSDDNYSFHILRLNKDLLELERR